jgi:3-dehydrosphinganine reductase
MAASSWFKGRSVIITGGSSGIGLAAARRVASYGATVTLVARRDTVLAEARAAVLSAAPSATVHTLALDVSDPAAVSERVGAHLAQHGADTLVNNAGVVMPGRFMELGEHHFREMMDINYFGTVHMCRAVLPHLVSRGGGAVLNVSSIDTPQLAFENQYKPAETRAIAGNVKTMSAEAVADDMLEGMAAGRFEIVPGFDGKLSLVAQRLVPSVVRWVCDSAQKKAARGG